MTLDDEKKTVGAFIRDLQHTFRHDHLIELKIKQFKIGNSVLDEKDPLFEVVLDGDEVEASIEGKIERKKEKKEREGSEESEERKEEEKERKTLLMQY